MIGEVQMVFGLDHLISHEATDSKTLVGAIVLAK